MVHVMLPIQIPPTPPHLPHHHQLTADKMGYSGPSIIQYHTEKVTSFLSCPFYPPPPPPPPPAHTTTSGTHPHSPLLQKITLQLNPFKMSINGFKRTVLLIFSICQRKHHSYCICYLKKSAGLLRTCTVAK